MLKNKIIKIILVLISIFMIVGSVNSAVGGLNVVLSSQNPDPVTPGNFVYVNVKISNSGTSSSGDVQIQLIENDFFSIASGDKALKNIGVVPSFSSDSLSNNYVISKFKIQVNANAPTGLNTISFKLVSGSEIYNYDFDILVQDLNPSLIISSFEIDSVETGSNQKLTIEIENPNSITLKNVVTSLALDLVTPTKSLSTLTGSNQKSTPIIKSGEKVKLEFDIISSPDAISNLYILPVVLTYEDSLGNSFSKTILGSVKIFSKPLFTVKLASQEFYTPGNSKVNIAIANPGTSTIKGTQIEILNSEDYEVLSGNFEYIGNLNPDDFQTLQSNIYFKAENDFNLKIKVNYLDSFNNVNEKIIDVPIKIYDSAELKSLGLVGSSNSSSGFGTTIFYLILAGLAFYFGRRLGINKSKKKN